MEKATKYAIIIGAGPAGLTAAYELLKNTGIKPIIIEASEIIGGLSASINYKGNRIDIGPHRFFSKQEKVMEWWLQFLPLQKTGNAQETISYHQKQVQLKTNTAPANHSADDKKQMLLVKRQTRIFFLGKFFSYPIKLSFLTIKQLGLYRSLRIIFSYIKSLVMPIKPEKNLEQFFINRFGKELYHTFFKSYTEKVWGVPCTEIPADWGVQRIKGLSVLASVKHALFPAQKKAETSLIEQFLYPALGAGQMWETVAEKIVALGGQIITGQKVTGLHIGHSKVTKVDAVTRESNNVLTYEGDYFFSTMPVKELANAIKPPAEIPGKVLEWCNGLMYRNVIQVCLLLEKLAVKDKTGHRKDAPANLMGDNWIYLQDNNIKAGRLQLCNNMSRHLMADADKVWIGVEYFCDEYDKTWQMPDAALIDLAVKDLEQGRFINQNDVLDATVIRASKAYPSYFGSYKYFDEIQNYFDGFENLYLIGRNGMHKYNNQDHSVLTAMQAVQNIINGVKDKSNIWAINTEEEYHEQK